jgi:hypothetical protein
MELNIWGYQMALFMSFFQAATLLLFFQIDSTDALLSRDLEIGNEIDGYYFGLITNIVVGETGYMYIADRGQSNIQVFAENGDLITKIGGPGRGPGEFDQLGGAGINKLGYLYALDLNLIRVSVFDIEDSNKLRKTLILPQLKNKTKWGSVPDQIFPYKNDNRFLIQYIIPYSPGTSDMVRKRKLVLFDENADLKMNPVLTFKENEALVDDSNGQMTVGSLPFGRKSLVFMGGKYLYYCWTESLEIDKYSLEGELIQTISYSIDNVEVSEKDIARKAEEFSSFTFSTIKKQAPDTWPVVAWFVIDDESNIWVAIHGEDRETHSLLVFRENGDLIIESKISETVELTTIKEGKAYGMQTYADGKQSVVRFDIQGI